MASSGSGPCNICGERRWGNQGSRENVRCLGCGSLERTRILKLHLDRLGLPRNGNSILHIAPERSLAKLLHDEAGPGYEAADLHPELFPFCEVKALNLCCDAESLPPNHYDLILHSHVVEHLPCNYTAVLFFLHRALKPGGYHIFSLPILSGFYEEDLGSLSEKEAIARFGQCDHVRRIGRSDLAATLGMIFPGDLECHRIDSCFDAETLKRANVPSDQWTTLNSSTVFVFGKSELRLST